MNRAKRLAREPLVHFLVVGALFFAISAWRDRDASSSSRIVVTRARIQHLAAGFARTWQRPPSEDELKALVDDYVRDEIATREAVAMGPVTEDAIVRRRLRQKLEFLIEESVTAKPPTDEELRVYLDANAERFRDEPRVSLSQVYVSRDRRGEAADADASRLLEELRAAGVAVAIDEMGDPLMAPQQLELAPRSEVAGVFGDGFADTVVELEPNVWAGPIESGFGLHLVLVREKRDGALPDLAVIRAEVEGELLARRRTDEIDVTYARLLEKYEVVVESGDPPSRRAGSE